MQVKLNGINNANRRAVSDIVVTVLLVLIGIAALSIVAVYINGTIKSVSLSPKLSCIDMQLQNVLKINRACYNSQTNEIEIAVQRAIADFNLEKINFVIDKGVSSTSWVCQDTCSNCKIPEPGKQKTYYFLSEKADSVAVSIDSCILDQKELADCPI